MSYIAVDLKVLEVHAPALARAMGVDLPSVIGSLTLLWHRCWSAKMDTITHIEVRGFFTHPEVVDMLEAFGFLEKQGATWRVKGADRYLRLRETRAKAGRARASKASRSAGEFTSTSPAHAGEPTSTPPAHAEHVTSTPPALTPSTEHRAPNTIKEQQQGGIAAFHIEQPDVDRIEAWDAKEFWRAAELVRRAQGLPPQKWPSPIALSRWWGEARPVADVSTLGEAFKRFCRDKYALKRSPPAPFELFMTKWNNHLPRSPVKANESKSCARCASTGDSAGDVWGVNLCRTCHADWQVDPSIPSDPSVDLSAATRAWALLRRAS